MSLEGGNTNTNIPLFLLTFTDYHCWLCHDFCGMNEENHHCWRNGKYGLQIHLQNTWNPIKSQFYYSSAQWKNLKYLSPSLESEKNYWDFFWQSYMSLFYPHVLDMWDTSRTCLWHVFSTSLVSRHVLNMCRTCFIAQPCQRRNMDMEPLKDVSCCLYA